MKLEFKDLKEAIINQLAVEKFLESVVVSIISLESILNDGNIDQKYKDMVIDREAIKEEIENAKEIQQSLQEQLDKLNKILENGQRGERRKPSFKR